MTWRIIIGHARGSNNGIIPASVFIPMIVIAPARGSNDANTRWQPPVCSGRHRPYEGQQHGILAVLRVGVRRRHRPYEGQQLGV